MHIQQAIDRVKQLLQSNRLDSVDIPDPNDVGRIMFKAYVWAHENNAWDQFNNGQTAAEGRALLCSTFNQWLDGNLTVTL